MILSKTETRNKVLPKRKGHQDLSLLRNHTEKRQYLRSGHWIILMITLGALGYAILRYCVFKGTPWQHIPLFVMNKALALSSVILIALFYIQRWKYQRIFQDIQATPAYYKPFRTAGYLYLTVHILISIVLLKPAYYPQFFQQDMFNFSSESMLLSGIIGFIIFTFLKFNRFKGRRQKNQLSRQGQYFLLGNLAMLLINGHLLILGSANWFSPMKWPGYLPPITMLAFLVILFLQVLGANYYFRKPFIEKV